MGGLEDGLLPTGREGGPGKTGDDAVAADPLMVAEVLLDILGGSVINPGLRAALAGFVDKLSIGLQGEKIGLAGKALHYFPGKGAGARAKLYHHFSFFYLGLFSHELG